MNKLRNFLNHGSLSWLKKSDQKPLSELPPPFFCARDISEVHDYFYGYNVATDPYLQSEGPLPGHCFVCRDEVLFEVDRPGDGTPVNWRETMRCPRCHLINRWRSSLHLFEAVCHPDELDRIYITEALTPLAGHLSDLYPNLTSSEFLSDARPGEVLQIHDRAITNQDVTQLTFDEGSFDSILTFDVLEHVPHYRRAVQEFYRVLDDGGHLILTAPFSFQKDTWVRAIVNDAGEIEHLMEPCYHGDPLSDEGVLAYYDFGMELLDEFKAIGFEECFLACYASNHWGYPAGNIAFVARKGR